jgi:hypothetical protein
MVFPMFDPVALFGLNPPSEVLRCHIGCRPYTSIPFFGSSAGASALAKATCLPNAHLVDLIFILSSNFNYGQPEKTCGAPQDVCLVQTRLLS